MCYSGQTKTFVTVFYERFRKVCPQYNIVVHAMECNRSMRQRKICPQCNTVAHVKRSVCDCGHDFPLKKRKTRCTAVGEPENTIKRRKALLSEEELLVRKERDKSSQMQDSQADQLRVEVTTCLLWPLKSHYLHHILFHKYHTYLYNSITSH